MESNSFLRPEFLRFLRATGVILNHHSRLVGKKQWQLGDALNKEWGDLTPDVRDEINKDTYLEECAFRLNEALSFPVACAETLDFYMKVTASYAGISQIEIWKDTLSFSHFARAKHIAADPTNNITAIECLARAYDMKWTAREMEQALTKKPNTDPAILELRCKYPRWLWPVIYPLARMNGNRKQAEYHLSEFVRLVETE